MVDLLLVVKDRILAHTLNVLIQKVCTFLPTKMMATIITMAQALFKFQVAGLASLHLVSWQPAHVLQQKLIPQVSLIRIQTSILVT